MAYLVQLGVYNPVTDGWQVALDLNDGQTLEVDAVGGLELPAPPLEVYAAGNPRVAGERVLRGQYGAREVTVQCVLGPLATEAALAGVLKQLAVLQAQVLGPNGAQVAGVGSAPRVALLVQAPGVAAPVYADVLALGHDLAGAGDVTAWVRLWQEGLTIELLCAPFWRGPRVTLDNLIANPGMDQPGQVTLWADAATNANYVNGYALNAGSAPTIASTTLTIPAGADVSFGAANWGAITQWAVAFTASSAGTFTFWLHRSATNTGIQIIMNGTTNTLGISTDVAGTVGSLTSATVTLTNGTRYWLVASALPSINANALATLVQAQIFNYSSGAIGAAIGSPLYGAVTAANLQLGQCGFTTSGAALAISTAGGTNPPANGVTGIAADSWGANATSGDAAASPAWPGWDAATTYPGGSWASLRALSLTAPPAGKLNAAWTSPRAPVTGGAAVTGRVWVAQTGLSGTAVVTLTALQYTSGGSFISTLTLGTANAAGIGSGWVSITGTVTLAVNCGGGEPANHRYRRHRRRQRPCHALARQRAIERGRDPLALCRESLQQSPRAGAVQRSRGGCRRALPVGGGDVSGGGGFGGGGNAQPLRRATCAGGFRRAIGNGRALLWRGWGESTDHPRQHRVERDANQLQGRFREL